MNTPADEIDHGHRAQTCLLNINGGTGHERRIVGGAKNTRLRYDMSIHFPLIPDMIATCEYVNTQGKKFLCDFPGQTKTACRIFPPIRYY